MADETPKTTLSPQQIVDDAYARFSVMERSKLAPDHPVAMLSDPPAEFRRPADVSTEQEEQVRLSPGISVNLGPAISIESDTPLTLATERHDARLAQALSRHLKAKDTPSTELRPPPEYADKPDHWIVRDGEEPSLWTWSPHIGWALLVKHQSRPGSFMARDGYRYLGPAEWRESEWQREQILRQASNEIIQAAAVRIAELEAENAKLRDPARGARDLQAAEARVTWLEAENARLRSNVRSGVNPNPSQTWTAHMIWWPDELGVPYFDGEVGHRTVAPWSVKLSDVPVAPARLHPVPIDGPGYRYDPVTNRTYGVPVDAPPAPTARPLPPQALRGGDGVPR